MNMLSNIRIVLVETTHPGNIGAAARAMKNMCLERLYLVNPRIFPSSEATARASGADDILEKARVVSSLDEAVADCGLVFGASARSTRSIPWPQVHPREAATLIGEESTRTQVAVVFGREYAGLTNEELDSCGYLVHIPCNPGFSSLNLAAAVQVIAYEILMDHRLRTEQGQDTDSPLASVQQLEQLYEHFYQAMIDVGFLDPEKPKQLMRRIRKLFNRARLEESEVQILRGFLKQSQLGVKGLIHKKLPKVP